MAYGVKAGAIIKGLHPVMRKAIMVAEDVYDEHGKTLVITSGLDGKHSDMSYHYFGCAIDTRTNYFTEAEAKVVAAEIQKRLEFPYEVIVEKDHLHIEYDWDKSEQQNVGVDKM